MFRPYLIGRRYDTDARRVIDYMASVSVAPSKSYQNIIDQVMRVRKNLGEHQRDYVFYHWAAETETQALINWTSPGTFTLTKAGTVTHAANRGFTASGANADGLQSTFNPSTAGVGTNDVSVEVYSRTTSAAGARNAWGGATSAAIVGRLRNTGDVANFRLNMTASVSLPSGITNTTGLWSHLRNATTVAQVCQNGVQVGSDIVVVDQAASNQNWNWLNAVIGTNASSTDQIAYARICRAMTVARTLEHYQSAILPLMQWNGANV